MDCPEFAYPIAGSRSPKRNFEVASCELDCLLALAYGSLVTDGVDALGVPAPGVAEGLASFDGGCESPLGPMENRGPALGCAAIPAAASTDAAVSLEGLSSLCGDADRCGVMMSGAARCRSAGTAPIELLPSLDWVAAGVSGGECTADAGGDARGEGWAEPAGMCIRLGVADPDGTLETG